jgi:hypothetical protein
MRLLIVAAVITALAMTANAVPHCSSGCMSITFPSLFQTDDSIDFYTTGHGCVSIKDVMLSLVNDGDTNVIASRCHKPCEWDDWCDEECMLPLLIASLWADDFCP